MKHSDSSNFDSVDDLYEDLTSDSETEKRAENKVI